MRAEMGGPRSLAGDNRLIARLVTQGVSAAITTPRLELRSLVAADAGALQAVTDHPAVTTMVSFLPTPFTIGAATALIDRMAAGRDLFLGIWCQTARDLVGVVGLHERDSAIEIGYWIGERHQGQGFATEAGHAVLERLTMDGGGSPIVARCRPDHRASRRVLEKLGFAATERPARQTGLMLFERAR